MGMGAAAPVAYMRFLEPGWLKLTTLRCALRGTRLRLLHLSDFHASAVVPKSHVERAIELGLSSRPDLICLTGDFITAASGFDPEWYAGALRRLSQQAPAYACMGNHDGGAWAVGRGGFDTTIQVASILRQAGITWLHNEVQTLEIRGKRLRLVGLGDLWAQEFKPEEAFASAPSDGTPTLVLAHNPDSKDRLARQRWDLMLNGHTHGGQFSLPLIGTPFAPVLDQQFVAGLHTWRGRQIHITKGVGNLHGLRFNCRPEVSLLELG